LHRYLVGLVTLFVLATAGGVFYGRIQAERDALQSAADDASFGARLAATQLATGIATVRASVAQVAANPSIAQIFARPQACTLSFALSGAADAGHIDLLRPDGSVVCSSRSGSGAKDRGYAGADWMGHALRDPVFAAPVADPVTGKQVVLTTAPVPGLGVMAGFVDLSALGPALSNLLGGPRHLEFLVTSADGETVLTRSIEPARWVGTTLDTTPFAAGAGPVERPDVAGVVRLYGRTTVTGSGWQVYAGADRAQALPRLADLPSERP
jgi:hypothetical protein